MKGLLNRGIVFGFCKSKKGSLCGFSVVLLLGAAVSVYALRQGSAAIEPGASAQEAHGSVSPLVASSTTVLQPLEEEYMAVREALDRIADRERDGGYIPGLALREAALRENAGDRAGALFAAFKELLWLYTLLPVDGEEALSTDDLLRRLDDTAALYPEDQTLQSARSALEAFVLENWEPAVQQLSRFITDDDEPDSFTRFLYLVSRIESGSGTRVDTRFYAAQRGRYQSFPLYWYHASRFGNTRPEAAERCIVLAPQGPYAQAARQQLAALNGLEAGSAMILLTRPEIEELINKSLATGDPDNLNSLFPLLTLPDNPFTLYALHSLRPLAEDSRYARFFGKQATLAQGRLAERLRYIAGATL